MQLTCPVRTSKDWIDLVKVQGSESIAAYLWNTHNGYVPNIFYSQSIEKVLKSQNILYRQAELGNSEVETIKDTLYSTFIDNLKDWGGIEKLDADALLGVGANKGAIANKFGEKLYKSANDTSTDPAVMKALKIAKLTAINLEFEYEAAKESGNAELEAIAKEKYITFLKQNGIVPAYIENAETKKIRNTYKNIYKNWYSKEDPNTGNTISVGWREMLVSQMVDAGYSVTGSQIVDDEDNINPEDHTELQDQLLNSTGGVDKIYNKQHIEESPAKKLTQQVKQLLASIPSGQRNWLGSKTYLPKDEVYKALLNIWVNKQSFADMQTALEAFVKYKPAYRHVLDFVNTLDAKDKSLMYTAFAMTYNKFSIFKKEITKSGITVKIFDSNLKTISKAFIGKWRQQSVEGSLSNPRAMYVLKEDNTLEYKQSAVDEINKNVKLIEDFLKDRKKSTDTLIMPEGEVHPIVRALGDVLWSMSMNIGSDATIDETYNNLQAYFNNGDNIKGLKGIQQAKGRTLFIDLYSKVKQIAAPVMTSKKVINIYENNKGDIEYIARILPYFINQVGDSFTNGSGKQIYPANLETEMSQIINLIKDSAKGGERRAMYLKDAFISGYNSPQVMSYLFQHFGSSKFLSQFENRILDAVIDDTTFSIQDYEDFSKLDSVIARINAYINNGNKETHYTSMTLGSRGSFHMVSMPRLGNINNFGVDTTAAKEIRKQIIQDFIRIHESTKLVEAAIATNSALPLDQQDFSTLIDGVHYKVDGELTNTTILESLLNKTGREFSPEVMQFTAKNELGNQIVTDQIIGEPDKLNKNGIKISHYIEDYVLDSTKLDPAIKGKIDLALDTMVQELDKYFTLKGKELLAALKEGGSNKTSEIDISNGLKISENLESLMKDFVVNDALARNELVKLFRGRRSMAKNVVEFYKRMELLGTPGSRLAEKGTVGNVSWMAEEYGAPKELVESTIQDIKLNMDEAQKLRVKAQADSIRQNFIELGYDVETANAIADSYMPGEVDGTDALAHLSLDGYRYIKQGQGLWGREEEEAYKAYKAAPAGQKIFAYQPNFAPKGFKAGDRVPILPMKPFYGALVEENGVVMSVVHKNSYQVLVEEYTKNFPVLEDLRNSMENRGIHIVNTVSAKKLARTGVHVVRNERGEFDTMATQTIPTSGLRFPQTINPTKPGKKQVLTKQVKKVVLSNVQDQNIYAYNVGLAYAQAASGADIKRNFHGALEEKMRREVEKIEKELGFDKLKKALNTKNTEDVLAAKTTIIKAVRDILKNNVIDRQLSSNYMRALDIEIAPDGTPRFRTPLDIPFYAKKFESIILSVFQKRAYDQKVSGYEAVQVAQIGGHEIDNELKFLGFETDPITGKRIIHAECMIREDIAARYGIKPGDNLDSIPEELRRIIGFRTPTQGKSSMIILKIAKVLPMNYEKAIVVPGQITKMMGSDFDVDKLNLMFSETEEIDGEIRKIRVDYNALNTQKDFSKLSDQQINNVLFDSIEAVLSNPNHALEIFKPLDSTRISDEQKRIRKAFPEFAEDLDWNSPLTESEITDRNIVAGKLVGKYANMQSGRNVVVNGSVKAAQEYAIIIDGVPYTDYRSNTIDTNESTENPISDKLTGALDASKNPAQKELNDNLATANVTAMFLALYPESNYTTLHNFLNQPIIRDFTRSLAVDYKNNLKDVNKAYKRAFAKWSSGVMVDVVFGNPMPRKPLSQDKLKTVNMSSTELANLSRENRDKKAQLDMLDNFYKLFIGGRQLFKLYKRVTPDTLNSINRVGDFQAFNDVIKNFDSDEVNENKKESTAWLNAANPEINVIEQFISDDSVYGLTKIYDRFLENTYDNIKNLFSIRLSDGFQFLKDQVLQNTGRSALTAEMHEAVDNGLYFMLLLREDSPIKDAFTGPQIRRMYTNQTTNLVSTFRNLKIKAPALASNYLINALEEEVDNTNNLFMLKFTGAFGLEPFMKEKFIKAFENLLYTPEIYSANPEVVKEIELFAKDLIYNNFIRYGFRSAYGSYADIIPHQFFNTPMKAGDSVKTINEYLHEQKTGLQSPNYFQFEDVVDFVQMFGALQIKGSTLLNRAALEDVKELQSVHESYSGQTFMIFLNKEKTQSGLYMKTEENVNLDGKKVAKYVALDKTYAKNKLYGIHKDAASSAYKDRLNAFAEISTASANFAVDARISEKETIQKICTI